MNNTSSIKEEFLLFIKQLENKASQNGLTLTQHLAVTGGPEMRAILQRMIKAELRVNKSDS